MSVSASAGYFGLDAGRPNRGPNRGLQTFKDDLMRDPVAPKPVEAVPVAAGMAGWRRALSASHGGAWMTASALGVVVGGGLIGSTSVVAFN